MSTKVTQRAAGCVDSTRRWARANPLFRHALQLTPAERSDYLAAECGDDPQLLAEIAALLRHANGSSDFLEEPAVGADLRLTLGGADGDPALSPGTVLGEYRLLRRIGCGGMSEVYEARQANPPRSVAVKILRLGSHAGRSALRRFHDEAGILGRLQHDGIAQIYEVGAHAADGLELHFIALEYLADALPLVQFAATRDLSRHARLELFVRVCDAVYHAHQHGVIHRDLKPSNILVDAAARVKVIDFGVARLMRSVDRAEPVTLAGELVGTPTYMSPEQFAGGVELDVRSDVYSLGVVLYELVCGETLYRDWPGELPAVAPLLQVSVPLKPNAALPRDLATIVSKALATRREERYGSVADLCADVGRYLQHRPVLARPVTVAYRLRKLVRRHPRVSTAVLVVILALAVSAGLVVREVLIAQREQRIAAEMLAFLDRTLADAHIQRHGEEVRVRDLLGEASRRLDAEPARSSRVEAQIRRMLGRTYEALADYASAEREYTRALPAAIRAFGRDDSQVVLLRVELAGSLYDRGDFAGAARDLEQLLLERDPSGQDGSIEIGKIRNDLGITYLNLHRPADAERELARALAIRAAQLGERHADVQQTTYNYAVAQIHLQHFDVAERLLGEGLTVCEELGREVRPLMTSMQRFRALSLSRLNRCEEALELASVALAEIVVVSGDEHPDFAAALVTNGQVLQACGQAEKARIEFERAGAIYTAVLGEEHPYTKAALLHQASVGH
jgi:serine/threonine protein kinase